MNNFQSLFYTIALGLGDRFRDWYEHLGLSVQKMAFFFYTLVILFENYLGPHINVLMYFIIEDLCYHI